MSLSVGSTHPLPPIPRPGGSPPTFEGNTGKGNHNRNAVTEWALPLGKKFSDFFDPKRCPDNLKGWPVQQHKSKKKGHQVICLKFQVQGSCRKGCGFTHVEPGTLDRPVYDKLDAKFREVYKS